MDTFTGSARFILDETARDLRRAIEGLSPAQLNQRPDAPETNSIAVLVGHAMGSTRWWLSVAITGDTTAERSRDDEFAASAPSAASLIELLDASHAECRALLSTPDAIDWAEVLRPPDGAPPFLRSWALMHAIEHLREHTGQVSLTRQLIDAR